MQENVFDRLANHYDTPERIALAAHITAQIKPYLADAKEQVVVDYGGGTGLIGLACVPLVKQMVIVDVSEKMLAIAQHKITQAHLTQAAVLQADFTQNKPTIQADIVLVSLVLLHIPDTKKILAQLFAMLNPDGQVFIVDFDANDAVKHPKVHSGFQHAQLTKLLQEIGFQDITIQTFHQGEKLFMKQDASLFLATGRKK